MDSLKQSITISENPKKRKESLFSYLKRNPSLYILLLPGFIYLIIFHYIPMYGIVIAFQDFSSVRGLSGSEWVGLKNFRELFESTQFLGVLENSITFSLMRIAVEFPAPILLALMLNEIRNDRYKRIVQTVSYIPHFISWVVVCGLVKNILSPTSEGIINALIVRFGGSPISFLQSSFWFRPVVIAAEVWKEAGWGAIIYLAALASVDVELYEAAIIDGASRWQRIIYITLPGIKSTIVVMLILRMGSVLQNGFEQIFLLYSPMVYDVADVFETYIYRTGILERRFSYSTAVGLFKSVVGMIMIALTNYVSKRMGERGLW